MGHDSERAALICRNGQTRVRPLRLPRLLNDLRPERDSNARPIA